MDSKAVWEVEKDEAWFEKLRNTEYAYLDKQKHTYLDFTGSGLASSTQYLKHSERLLGEVCGNPHSLSPASQAATNLIDQTRLDVLEYFNASPKEYVVIFTSNATSAAKLVAESYPFSRTRRLVLTFDNHNSVNGMREYAKRGSSKTIYIPSRFPNLELDAGRLSTALRRGSCWRRSGSSGLFVYPAQSNFSGVQHSLEYTSVAQAQGYDVLLDASAYVPTNTLDLSDVKPEFVIMSWYKVFGFPTGVGCLIAKRSALARLRRPWFSGGTIQAVSVGIPWHKMAAGESAFEDGTLNFQAIPDVLDGLHLMRQIDPGRVHSHVQRLTAYFLRRLSEARHSSGSPMSLVYGPEDMNHRGGTVAFNILDIHGTVFDERVVAMEASAARISIRTGCFCNPGAGEDIFQLRVKTLRRLLFSKNPSIDDYIRLLGLPSAGAIRVSFGIPSTMADVDCFMDFMLMAYRDRVASNEGLPPRENC